MYLKLKINQKILLKAAIKKEMFNNFRLLFNFFAILAQTLYFANKKCLKFRYFLSYKQGFAPV